MYYISKVRGSNFYVALTYVSIQVLIQCRRKQFKLITEINFRTST